jgi:hypothetical protein
LTLSPVVADLDDALTLLLTKSFLPVGPRVNRVKVKSPSRVRCLPFFRGRVHRYDFSSIFQENVTVSEVVEVAVTV